MLVMKSSKIPIASIKDKIVLITPSFSLETESFARFLITSKVDDMGVGREGDDDDPAADFSNGDDNNDEDTDALAGNTAADGECDEGDGNGKINVKGDCDIDCNRV